MVIVLFTFYKSCIFFKDLLPHNIWGSYATTRYWCNCCLNVLVLLMTGN